jgi:hypothetical protein
MYGSSTGKNVAVSAGMTFFPVFPPEFITCTKKKVLPAHTAQCLQARPLLFFGFRVLYAEFPFFSVHMQGTDSVQILS